VLEVNDIISEKLHAVNKKFLGTDLGIYFGATLVSVWLAHHLITRAPIDLVGVVTLLGFLMVFFIERTHAKEMKVLNLKLDELLGAHEGASNRLIRAEDEPEEFIHNAHDALHDLAERKGVHEAVSIDHTRFFDQPG
jgi:low affinity Fe/Cu permease